MKRRNLTDWEPIIQAQRIRTDRDRGASHELIRLLNKPIVEDRDPNKKIKSHICFEEGTWLAAYSVIGGYAYSFSMILI